MWMLVDLKPGFEPLNLGDVIEGTTTWWEPETLPKELVSWDVPVTIERAAANKDGTHDWAARISENVSALLPNWAGGEGPATISGCLVYDRYLWLFHPTVPTARGQIIRRGKIAQNAHHRPRPSAPGWYSTTLWGPSIFVEFGTNVWPEKTIQWDCVQLDTD